MVIESAILDGNVVVGGLNDLRTHLIPQQIQVRALALILPCIMATTTTTSNNYYY